MDRRPDGHRPVPRHHRRQQTILSAIFTTAPLTVVRAVTEVASTHTATGLRFAVKDYPKDREYRRVKLSPAISTTLLAHIADQMIAPGELLFPQRLFDVDPSVTASQPNRPTEAATGRTQPNARGHTYLHGTMTAYTLGRCRCEHCRTALATYRAQRRAAGKDHPRTKGSTASSEHLPRRWFRHHIWQPATTAAGPTITVRFHDLRHAHASWLLAGGADIQTVKARLGHGSLRTTERYLHTLPDADDTALNALSRIRNSHRLQAGVGCGGTCMPGRSLTSSGPKWSTKHHAPTIRSCRWGSSRRTMV
jgi:hypothetical protein